METNELGYCRYLWICYDILDLALGQDFGLQIIFKIWFRNTELFFKNHFIVPNVFLFRNQGSEEFFRTAGSKMGGEAWTPFSQYTVALRMNPAYGGYLQTDKDGNCLGLEIKGGCIICGRKIIIHEKNPFQFPLHIIHISIENGDFSVNHVWRSEDIIMYRINVVSWTLWCNSQRFTTGPATLPQIYEIPWLQSEHFPMWWQSWSIPEVPLGSLVTSGADIRNSQAFPEFWSFCGRDGVFP